MDDKIDFVITWVDGFDSEWRKKKTEYQNKNKKGQSNWATSEIRFRDWGILKYWFRAVEKYAPWVNKIYFVTCGQKPKWLNEKNKKLVLVNHEDFMPSEYLPTFNSNSIELNLFRIKGLSEKFVYFNDDMFLNAPVFPKDFFRGMNPVIPYGFDLVRTDYGMTNSDINNARIYNKYFSKKEVFLKNWKLFLKPRNGKYLLKTICLLPWPDITGVAENHGASAHTKSTFREIWSKEFDILNKTSSNKFREAEDVNHWIAKGWHVLTGDAYPQKPKYTISYAKYIDAEIIADLQQGKHKIVCINDIECSEKDFVIQKEILQEAFEKKFNKKSSFEK